MTANVGQAELEVVPAARGFGRQLEGQLNSEMPKAADRAGQKSGKRFSSGFGAALKRGGAIAGLGGIGLVTAGLVKNSVKLEASFSKTMAQIGASTEGAGGHIDELNKLAMKMGAQTSFSASDAAGAMLELGKAGINASDIMGGALQGTLTLAAAGSLDLGTASTIASNAMNTFSLKGKDMASIAAALAGGANASTASVESLGQALGQVGPGATNAGLSLQETVGVLSAFDQAGIKGSDAGTSLKTMLTRLVPQTDKASGAMRRLGLDFTDAQGNFVPITNVAEQLKTKLSGLSEEQRSTALTTIFGSDATRAATVLMKEGAKGISGYVEATKDQAAAEKLAKVNTSGTAGAMERLQGSIETAELALGQALAPTIEKTANFLSQEAVPAVTGFIQGMQDGTGAGGDLADVLGDMVDVGKAVVGFINDLPGPVKKFGVEALIAAVVLNKLNSGFTRLGGSSIGGFVTGMSKAETRMETTRKAAFKLGGALRQAGGAAGAVALASGLSDLNKDASNSQTALGGLKTVAGATALGFAVGGPLGAGIGATAGTVVALTKTFGLFGTAAKNTNETFKVSASTLETYAGTLDGVSAAITSQTRAAVLQELQEKGLLDSTRKLGLSDREAINAMTGNAAARQKLSDRLSASTKLTNKQKDALRTETGAVATSRLAQLKHNVAIANSAGELKKAKTALRNFMKSPASKRVSITGDTDVITRLHNVRDALNQVFGRGTPEKTSGPGGIDVLLNPEGAGATGAIVRRPTIALIGESGPEALVPLNRTPGNSPLPVAGGGAGSTPDRFVLVLDDGTQLGGYVSRQADTRVGAASGMSAMRRRAGGR